MFGKKIFHLLLFMISPKPDKHKLALTTQLKNSKLGRVALILGNGPSLDKLNTESVSSNVYDVFVVNNFYKSRISSKVRPDYYVLSDPTSFKEDSQALGTPTELAKYLKTTESTLVLPHNAEESFLSEIKKIYFDDRDQFFFNKNIDPTKPRGYTSVTLYKAIAMACFFGYSKIYILGLDNTEFLGYRGSPGNVLLSDGTSYASSLFDPENENEFEPQEYYSSDYQFRIAGRMQTYAHLFGDLELFPKSKICMLDKHSLIDAFKKESKHSLVLDEF
jgi:hypothetical protein